MLDSQSFFGSNNRHDVSLVKFFLFGVLGVLAPDRAGV